ncbi:aminotransferase class III-fold pyridoxal phosphate-dependent enzyme [Rhodococcus sp. APC 3903]|uniref:aspartate aminotransferase family protein n=1 Tax=Rhodococcus sp. APC 3903 TaxID=3035193 RepID=UPI0025B4AAFB|nr:aminotransferase class III-fold pyridoxal phosphate-dependent enzyme [Rhodococcus sp. APC 3903]MDN3460701.1 aminotransferase class III-fold pyridoxal phosphate-dependent enzyme [Rhodococcus sp. APC 3903]
MTALHSGHVVRPASGSADLLRRRYSVLGPNTPMFYADDPLQIVSASGVRVTGPDGRIYLDAYNNVPHVGHCHPAVVDAVTRQLSTVNVHSRYLTDAPIAYAEALLALFPESLDRMFFTNSGSEANDLALRMARFQTRSSGILISDHSYHGNTQALAALTTGLPVSEPLGEHVRTFTAPDARDSKFSLADALAQIDSAIAELEQSGHGLSAVLFDPLFSTEGLPDLPEGYIEGLCARVRTAGGVVICDEVQSGFGRTAQHMWGFQSADFLPDMVVLGKPMGNGFPLGAVVTSAGIIEPFSADNTYFNTFATTPAAASAGHAVLKVMNSEGLLERARAVSAEFERGFRELVDGDDRLTGVRGTGMFLGMQFVDAATGAPDGPTAKVIVDAMRRNGVLIGRIGRYDEVLKIRPPLAFGVEDVPIALDAFAQSLRHIRR